MMMAKIVEHFITGLQQDCEQLRQQRDLSVFDSEARKKKEMKLYQQLLELLETERKYVQDLEQVGALKLLLFRLLTLFVITRSVLTTIIYSEIAQAMPPLTGRKPARLKEKAVIFRCSLKILRKVLTQSVNLVRLHSHLVKSKLFCVTSAAEKLLFFRVRQMLGNLDDIKDYHKKVFLPRLEEAVSDSKLMRFVNHSML